MDQTSITNASVTDESASSNLSSNSSGPPPWGKYTGFPVQPGGTFPSVPELIVYSYSSSIVFRRWAATILDVLVLAGLYGTAIFFNSNILFYLVLGFTLLYYLLLEGFTGHTAGKYILRIQVVREDGRPPGFVKSLIRTLLRIVDTNPGLLGGLPAGICALVTKKKQRLGDMAANTYVIKVADSHAIKPPSRRTKMTLAVIFFTIILFAAVPNVIAWTTTGYPETQPKTVIHMSEDGKFQIMDRSSLKRDSSGAAELGANLALSNALNTRHIVVFTYSKEEIGTEHTLEDFYLEMQDLLRDNVTSGFQERKFAVDSGLGYEMTYQQTIDGEPYMYIAGYVETSEHFHEVTAIMDVRNYEKYGAELRAAIATFREVDP
ncbi:RDD family protein [Paenibacillus bouchesdurhonensis]|uniref:RDD family protein n=1 Tax=Paenibacillus bouchesdurhonensis TaxID=1870990 RepID=UPI000FC0DDFC|nr:RDD family protein [Paenibacillus bouchesdurhonensis]